MEDSGGVTDAFNGEDTSARNPSRQSSRSSSHSLLGGQNASMPTTGTSTSKNETHPANRPSVQTLKRQIEVSKIVQVMFNIEPELNWEKCFIRSNVESTFVIISCIVFCHQWFLVLFSSEEQR